MRKLAALLLIVSMRAQAQLVSQDSKGEPPTPIGLKLNNDDAEAAVRPTFHLGHFDLTPVLRGGLLAPFGALPDSLSVLRTSPYAVGGLDLHYSGALESLVLATVGYTQLNSQKAISDPKGTAASPANSLPNQTQFSQPTAVASAYADLGKVIGVSPTMKMAFFAAADTFGFQSLHGAAGSYSATGLGEGNFGALLMHKSGQNEATVFAQGRLEEAPADMFRNSDVTVVPAATAGAEYARTRGSDRLAVGLEGTAQRADLGLRPYAQWSRDNVSAMVAGNFRKSENPFYPDSAGAGAEVKVEVARGVQLGALANFSRDQYSMAPGPETNYGAMGTLTISLDKIFHSEAGARVRARAAQERQYSAQDSYDMNSRLPQAAYPVNFRTALANSPTFSDFVKSIPVHGTDDILAAVSAFTNSFSDKNYNYNEGPVPNSNNVDDIYKRGRASYLNGTKDPMLVCIGSSQFAAVLAEALGKQAGIPIEAMASHVEVPDQNGQQAGHAIAAVKTREYGIVFVDWGRLTPTYTFDTKQAFRVYQALQGIPSVFHTVTAGADGHPVGYLFTDDGKAMVNNLTFHDELPQPPLGRVLGDDPSGAPLTVERFKQITRGKF